MTAHALRRPRAFTLVELLVVISIILTLAALSLMGIRQFRGAANKVVAIRNISQLQIANAGYAMDHGGRYMPVYVFDDKAAVSSSWFTDTTFLSFLNGDHTIKSSTNSNTVALNLLDPIVTRARKNRYDTYDSNFGYNHEGHSGAGSGWGNASTNQSWFVSQVVAPTQSCAFITCTDWIAKYSGRSLWKDPDAVEGKTGDGKIAYRHQGGKALVVYYDGHVGEMTMKDIEKLDQNADPNQKGIKNLFWDADGK